MKINTSRFGEIDIDEKDLIQMPDGLIGFPELVQFILLDHDEQSPFKWLQSCSDPEMAFVVISPLAFCPDYLVEVSPEEILSLNLNQVENAVISVIVTIPAEPQKMSANLKAPLVFNLENRMGKQIILKDSNFQTKHFIMDELKKISKKDGLLDFKNPLQQQIIGNKENSQSIPKG